MVDSEQVLVWSVLSVAVSTHAGSRFSMLLLSANIKEDLILKVLNFVLEK